MAAHAFWKLNFSGIDTGTVLTLANVELRTSVGGSDVTLPAATSSGFRFTNRAQNTLGPAALTMIQDASADDSNIAVTLPFNVTFDGVSYSTVYVCSNGYLTFGAGANNYSGLSETNPAIPKIMINAGDRSYQRVYTGSENAGTTFRIVYEGTSTGSGTPGASTVFWEVTFNSSNPSTILIDFGANAASGSGVSMMASASASFKGFGSGTLNTGYTWEIDASADLIKGSSGFSEYAIDDNDTTNWAVTAGDSGYLIYQFNVAKDIVEHTITAPAATMVNAPRAWSIAHSDDGISWLCDAFVGGQTAWTANEKRVFTHSSNQLNTVAPRSAANCKAAPMDPDIGAAHVTLVNHAAMQSSPMISGTVKQGGVACARLVRAYGRLTGAMLDQVMSSATTGAFSLNARGHTDACYVVAFDDLGVEPDYNAQIFDLVMPD